MHYKWLYITLGDEPSGVYQSQVIDVCRYLNEKFDVSIGLLAFISIRNYRNNRRRIKKYFPEAMVLPMVPKLKNWRYNFLMASYILSHTKAKHIICRNPLSANLGLQLKKYGFADYVIYDGRGAVAEEWNEYHVVNDSGLLDKIANLEMTAVNKSDFRISVSNQLINYWENKYDYNNKRYVVIPCTLSNYNNRITSVDNNRELRNKLGIAYNDIVLVYAGSTAGWQSFNLMSHFISKLMLIDTRIKILFLSKADANNNKLLEKYPNKIFRTWVKPIDVFKYLSICDYGLLLREESITNSVAAPTKFAEYLASGLSVIISRNVGDYTEFVQKHNCGIIIPKDMDDNFLLDKPTREQKLYNEKLAHQYFSKDSAIIHEQYKILLESI
jgi:glycosyltransferase involved in cell wall biosynthesis